MSNTLWPAESSPVKATSRPGAYCAACLVLDLLHGLIPFRLMINTKIILQTITKTKMTAIAINPGDMADDGAWI